MAGLKALWCGGASVSRRRGFIANSGMKQSVKRMFGRETLLLWK